MTRTDADIIVVGAGGGGMMTAVAAAQNGAKVVLIEKNNMVGGTHYFSGGSWTAANSRLTALAGADDNPDKFYAEAMGFGNGKNHPELLRKLVDNAGPVLDWLLDNGLELRLLTPGPALAHTDTGTYRTYWGKEGGKSYVKTLGRLVNDQVDSGNIDLKLGTKLTALLRRGNGPIEGVRIENRDGKVSEIAARSVVLASGGYGGSQEMVRRLNPQFQNVISECPPHADGSAILAAEAAGAALVNMDFALRGSVSMPSATSAWRRFPSILRLGPPHVSGHILVSSEGKRIVNEDTPGPSARKDALTKLPDKTMYMVFDSRIRQSIAMCPVVAWNWQQFDEAAASNINRQVIVADSIEELAGKSGINPAGLAATVDKWNHYVREGRDPDFGREPNVPLDKPPYYALVAKECIAVTHGGLKVNGDSQVIDGKGRAIPGLFAVGEAIGMGQYMGDGLNSGFGDVGPMVFGKLVGEALARAARE